MGLYYPNVLSVSVPPFFSTSECLIAQAALSESVKRSFPLTDEDSARSVCCRTLVNSANSCCDGVEAVERRRQAGTTVRPQSWLRNHGSHERQCVIVHRCCGICSPCPERKVCTQSEQRELPQPETVLGHVLCMLRRICEHAALECTAGCSSLLHVFFCRPQKRVEMEKQWGVVGVGGRHR